jgi:hypothetical protein
VESFDTSWFRGFEVFEEWGSPNSSSREVILSVDCEEDTWQWISKFRRKSFREIAWNKQCFMPKSRRAK